MAKCNLVNLVAFSNINNMDTQTRGNKFGEIVKHFELVQNNGSHYIYGSIFGKRDLLAIDHLMLALFWSYVPNMK